MMFVSTQGTSPVSAIDTVPELGKIPVPLEVTIDLKSAEEAVDSGLAAGIRELYASATLCDVTLVVDKALNCAADSPAARFPAHRVAVASASAELMEFILAADVAADAQLDRVHSKAIVAADADVVAEHQGALVRHAGEPSDAANLSENLALDNVAGQVTDHHTPAEVETMDCSPANVNAEVPPKITVANMTKMVPGELRFPGISSPEAVQAMLTYIYELSGESCSAQEYTMPSDEANKDVLRLAQRFKLQPLQDRAMRFLTSELSTSNVIQRLATCEEFELEELRERIIEQITQDQKALAATSSNMEIMKHPRILQDLLVQVAAQQMNESTSDQKPAALKRAAAESKESAIKKAKHDRIALAGA